MFINSNGEKIIKLGDFIHRLCIDRDRGCRDSEENYKLHYEIIFYYRKYDDECDKIE